MASRVLLSLVLVAMYGSAVLAKNIPAPISSQPSGYLVADQNATIVDQSEEYNPDDGSYAYSFQTSNGFNVRGYSKENKTYIEGSYYINSPEGIPTLVKYTADERGFLVESDAVPKPHPDIVKIIEYAKTLPPPTEVPQEELE